SEKGSSSARLDRSRNLFALNPGEGGDARVVRAAEVGLHLPKNTSRRGGITALDRRNNRLSDHNGPRAPGAPSAHLRNDIGGPACAARLPFLDNAFHQVVTRYPAARS